MQPFYYTAHRLEGTPQSSILIVRRQIKQLRRFNAMSHEEKVQLSISSPEDGEFLLIFENGMNQSGALEELEAGHTFWQESCNQYSWTGFGLTRELALKALDEADAHFGFRADSH